MQRLKLVTLSLLVALATPILGQSTKTYDLSFKKEALFLGAGAGFLGTGYWIDSYNTPLSEEDIIALDEDDIPGFERWIINNHSVKAGNWSNISQNAALAAPLIIFISREVRSEWKTVTLMYAETILLTKGITHLTKTIVQRPRPYVYNEDVDIREKMAPTSSRSFFSGHTSQTAALSFLAAKTYADFHPESKWRPIVWTAAAILPAATGYLRMKGGNHFLTDVCAGYVVGGAIGLLVPHFHKIKDSDGAGSGWNIVPIGNGVLVQRQF